MQAPSRHYHSDSMECALVHLDSNFVVQNESEVERWCREQDIDYSVPARLAFFVIRRRECLKARDAADYRLPPGHVPVIPRPWDPEDSWRELREWRHPRLDLNLLQLAIVLNSDHVLIKYFWHPAFLREEIYRDESGRLVNHPFHLILALRHYGEQIFNGTLSLEDIREELLLEERTIDLTAARLQKRPSKATHQAFFDPLFSRDTEPEYPLVPFLRLNNLKTELASWTLTGTVVPFCDDMTSIDARVVLCTILRKIGESQPRASTVELLWQVQSDLSHRGFTSKFLQELERDVYSRRGQFAEDVQLLICQLHWAVKKEHRWMVTDPKKVEEPLLIKQSVCQKEPYLKACKFIPTEYLNLMISRHRYHFEEYIEVTPSFELLFREAADAMEDLQRGRTLQDHCVLSILDAVNGDAWKVWGLSELPEPLKQLFLLPFQELHKKLKAEEQSPVDAPDQEDEV